MQLRAWRYAIFATFFFVGACFASLISRMPHVRDLLGISTGEIGILLLAIAIGSAVGFAFAGPAVHRFGSHRVIPVTLGVQSAGVAAAAWAIEAQSLWGALAILAVTGGFISITDVAMNTSAAANERATGRTIMPIFHAFFSIGTVAGAGLGALFETMDWNLGAQATIMAALAIVSCLFIARDIQPEPVEPDNPVTRRDRLKVWTEPYSLLLGVMVLGMAFMEASANDWLALVMVDGHGMAKDTGAVMYTVFLASMTLTRVAGVRIIDRLGRVTSLRISIGLAIVGLATVLLVDWIPAVIIGTVVWGAGVALAFPLGISAAAEDPRLGAARVATVSAIGYLASFIGPPLIGFLSELWPLRQAMLILLVFGAISFLLTPMARPRVASKAP